MKTCLLISFSLALIASAVVGYSAQLSVQEVSLYVGAPAEVNANFTPDGESATFDLPPGLVADSVRANQGGGALSPTLQPIYKPQKAAERRQIERYQAQLSGLRAGAPVQLTFRTAGLTWNSASALTISGNHPHLEVQASITNDALDLNGAHLRLMSGHIGRAGEGGDEASDFEDPSDLASYLAAIQEYRRSATDEAGGLHVAAELDAADIPRGSKRQIPLLSADVAVTRVYRWDTYPPEQEGEGMPTPPQRAWALYTFQNGSPRPIPDGKVTVSEGGAVVGAGYAAWTPPGETAIVAIASVQGVTVRRSEETTPQTKTWETKRTTKLRVENSRDAKLTLQVVEHPRGPQEYDYSGQEQQPTYEFSQQPQTGKKDVFTWDLPVAARGQAEVTYSYLAPMDTTPLRVIAFDPDDSPKERAYLVEAPHTSVGVGQQGGQYRKIQSEGYILYRFPMPADVQHADLRVGLGQAFRVGLAPEVNGKPGAYTVVADATAIAGREVRDNSNRSLYTFDLSPFLSKTSRAVYFRVDDPDLAAGGAQGAWVGSLGVYRVPEGFASRAPGYPVGEQTVASGVAAGKAIASATPPPTPVATTPAPAPTVQLASPASRRLLLSFAALGPQAEDATYYEQNSHIHGDGKAVEGEGRLIYAFKIPADVDGVDCIVTAGAMFIFSVARADGGKPGVWHEELNAQKLFGHQIRDMENRLDYTIDLTPYLKDNPSRTIYLLLRPTTMDQTGAVVFHVELAVRDDAEKAQAEKRQRRLDMFVQHDRDRYVLLFTANGDPTDATYFVEGTSAHLGASSRGVEGSEYAVYRLPLTQQTAGAQLCARIDNVFVVGLAVEQNGKPGPFREAARGATKMAIDITSDMIAAGAVYLKFQYANPNQPGGIVIKEISIQRP
jgi:hypothetical protein